MLHLFCYFCVFISKKNMTILVTGGCGFVGSNLTINLKLDYPSYRIIAFDNLKRRGSELNITRLLALGIEFIHGDIRNYEDFEPIGEVDLILDAAAEPSVLSGINSSPDYVINTNLIGTINCLKFARKYNSKFILISTSRVYPIDQLTKIAYLEEETRLQIQKNQEILGVSEKGINEDFSLSGPRSFYGTSKLSSEYILQEYGEFYDQNYIINRCGVIAGPWQMGKIDQGVVVLWLAMHYFKKKLAYIGFGGEGKQLRDIIHIADIYALLKLQINNFELFNKQLFNVGGGQETSVSLKELTEKCSTITGNKIHLDSVKETRPADIPIYVTDNTKITNLSGWKPSKTVDEILADTYHWMYENEETLKKFL
jgi:CDP-paratose 2-epimerase